MCTNHNKTKEIIQLSTKIFFIFDICLQNSRVMFTVFQHPHWEAVQHQVANTINEHYLSCLVHIIVKMGRQQGCIF